MDEARLIERLQRIEALHAGAATAGEREAAARGRERLLARLRELEREEPPEEFQFSLADPWARRVFCALLRRYGIRPFRHPRQRRQTVMARVPRRFVDETLWPFALPPESRIGVRLAFGQSSSRSLGEPTAERRADLARRAPDRSELGAVRTKLLGRRSGRRRAGNLPQPT